MSNLPGILMIYPPNSGARRGIKGIYYPLGIGYIAAVLRNECKVRVHDLNYDYCIGRTIDHEYIRRMLEKERYDYLLIGGVFPDYRYIKEIIRLSRSISDAKIILGGSYLSPSIDSLGRFFEADYYVLGEGENTIRILIDTLVNKGKTDDIPGIAYHSAGKLIVNTLALPVANLDEVPFPARDLLHFDRYKRYFALGYPLLYTAYVIASRGCSLNCIFCNPVFGRKVRVRTPENILEEVCQLQRDYNCQFIYFHDELLLGGAKRHVANFCEYVLAKRNKKFYWGGTTNAQMLDDETIRLMSRAGCIRISFGVESGSKKILKEMRKKNDLEKLKDVVASCHKHGIETDFSLITNTFSETEETLNETKEYLKFFNNMFFRQPFSINYVLPIPGTDLYDEAKKRDLVDHDDLNNLMSLTDGSRYFLKYNLTELADEELIGLVEGVNNELKDDYYCMHKFQHILQKTGNLNHFRFKESFLSMNFKNIRPALEGLLWAMSRGDEDSKLGKIYKRLVYKADE